MLLIVESVPKLGYIFDDPLVNDSNKIVQQPVLTDDSSSSDDYLSSELNTKNLRRQEQIPESAGFEGYVFDENICKHVNGRILCGYDRNKGEIDEDKIVNLENGCRMKGDRLECGYSKGPFNTENKAMNLRMNSEIEDTSNDKNIAYNKLENNSITATSVINHTDSTTKEYKSLYLDKTSSVEPIKADLTTMASPNFTSEFTRATSNTDELTINESNTRNTTDPFLQIFDKDNHVTEVITLNKTITCCTNNITIPETTRSDLNTTHNDGNPLLMKILLKSSEVPKANSTSGKNTASTKSNTENYITNEIYTSTIYIHETSYVDNKQINKRNKRFTQSNNDRNNIKTTCYEQNDRVVCYDYKIT